MTSPPIAQVLAASHVAMEVSDLDRSIAFYQDVLGFEIFHDDRGDPIQPNVKGVIAGFGFELAQSRQAGATGRARALEPAPGGPCLSFSVANIDQAFARLRAVGCVEASAPSDVRGVRFFSARDPDGLIFELIQFPPPLTVLADLRSLRANFPAPGGAASTG